VKFTDRARAVVAFIVITAMTAPAIFSEESERTDLFISTVPSRAEILVDGNHIGVSPVVVHDLSSGEHLVEARIDRRYASLTVVVERDAVKEVVLELTENQTPSINEGSVRIDQAVRARRAASTVLFIAAGASGMLSASCAIHYFADPNAADAVAWRGAGIASGIFAVLATVVGIALVLE